MLREIATMDFMRSLTRRERFLAAQAIYFLATGIWPLVHIGSFTRITGPKVEVWLVRTFGALVAVNGLALLLRVLRRKVDAETLVLASGSAMVLAASDTYYVARGRIAWTYLIDAAFESFFAVAVLMSASAATEAEAATPTGTSAT